MDHDRLMKEARSLRFGEPAVESAYRADRLEREVPRARRILVALLVLIVGIGAVLGVIATIRQRDVPQRWLVLRFGMLAPALLATFGLTWTAWGRRNLQLVLAAGMAVVVGAFAIEWAVEWRPGMPLRGLWMIPLLTLWGCAMALPMGTRAVAGMTLGVFAISTTAIGFYVQGLGAFAIATALGVFAAAGYGIVLFARWREVEDREAFVNRRQIQVLADTLRERNEALERAGRMRDEFVEGVLHDIRSPLTAIFMSSSMLRRAREEGGGHGEFVDAIVSAGRRIDSFVTHFLEQRSLDRADAPPAIVDMSLDEAVDNIVTRARMAAVHKGQEIAVEMNLRGVVIRADELLFDRALSNLLDNAIKYSPMDSRIQLRIDTDPDASGRVRFSVKDEGPGISPEEMGRLFQPYARLEKKTTGGEHSVGLGLALVKKWTESMGGAVGCESEPGLGATFWISVPRE